jgi:hypothetical protein
LLNLVIEVRLSLVLAEECDGELIADVQIGTTNNQVHRNYPHRLRLSQEALKEFMVYILAGGASKLSIAIERQGRAQVFSDPRVEPEP